MWNFTFRDSGRGRPGFKSRLAGQIVEPAAENWAKLFAANLGDVSALDAALEVIAGSLPEQRQPQHDPSQPILRFAFVPHERRLEAISE